MSIASDLQGTADFIASWCLHKKNIPWGTAGLLAEKLLALADQVKHLENVPLRLDSLRHIDKRDFAYQSPQDLETHPMIKLHEAHDAE